VRVKLIGGKSTNEKHSNSIAGELHRVHEEPKRYLSPALNFIVKGN
jgi:hypothetical protein